MTKGWRTALFALLLIIAGQIQAWLPSVQGLMTPTVYGMLVSIIGVIVFVLRAYSDTPIFSPDPIALLENDFTHE
jgi:hypothetical protein